LQKLYQTLNELKNTPIYVCTNTAFVGWPTECRRISSFHNSLLFNHHFKKYFKVVYGKMVMANLTTGIMFLLFTCVHFWVSELYEGGLWVPQPPMTWTEIAESLRSTVLQHHPLKWHLKHKIYKICKVNQMWNHVHGEWSQIPARRTNINRPPNARLHHRHHHSLVCLSCNQSRHRHSFNFFQHRTMEYSNGNALWTLVIYY
jgi:hypothetical protein